MTDDQTPSDPSSSTASPCALPLSAPLILSLQRQQLHRSWIQSLPSRGPPVSSLGEDGSYIIVLSSAKDDWRRQVDRIFASGSPRTRPKSQKRRERRGAMCNPTCEEGEDEDEDEHSDDGESNASSTTTLAGSGSPPFEFDQARTPTSPSSQLPPAGRHRTTTWPIASTDSPESDHTHSVQLPIVPTNQRSRELAADMDQVEALDRDLRERIASIALEENPSAGAAEATGWGGLQRRGAILERRGVGFAI